MYTQKKTEAKQNCMYKPKKLNKQFTCDEMQNTEDLSTMCFGSCKTHQFNNQA